jgi:DNA topoisomerase 2-associated protein PAT1
MLAHAQQPKPELIPATQPTGPQPLTMEELERQMMQNMTMGGVQQGAQPPALAQPSVHAPAVNYNNSQQQHLPQANFPPPGQSPDNAMFPRLGAPSMAAQPAQGPTSVNPTVSNSMQPTEQVSMDLERKIMETEMGEAKRRRKALKIASMAKYNDIMTGGDKEFITRIQLSQLVTQDPYASDFYAQVHSAIVRSKMAAQGAIAEPAAVPGVLQVGAGGRGVGVGVVRGGPGRSAARLRDNAMQRMTMQVKRIVENAKSRGMKPASGECKKSFLFLIPAPMMTRESNVTASLHGALGTTGKRSTAAAPRPALQVSPTSNSNNVPSLTTMLAAGGEPGARNADGQTRVQPVTAKQVALRLEALYDAVLDLEQLRRNQPPPPSGGPDQQPYVTEENAHRASQFEEW